MVAQLEAETPGATLAYVETEAQDTDRYEGRITSRNTGSNASRDEGPDSWKNTERCCALGIGRHASCRSSRSRDKNN